MVKCVLCRGLEGFVTREDGKRHAVVACEVSSAIGAVLDDAPDLDILRAQRAQSMKPFDEGELIAPGGTGSPEEGREQRAACE